MAQESNGGNSVGVAIVAPGGYAPDESAFRRGIALLEKQGCRVFSYYDPALKHQRFGGTDEARVEQLHAAAANPEVRVVMALRGGYGMSRLLPHVDFSMLAASGKLFVGHSDFTAFQMALYARTGAVSFSGPMLCDDFTREEPSDFTLGHFWSCLSEGGCSVDWQASGNPEADVSGTLWGGNLAMLTHLAGTPWLPEVEGGILFVEDINEHPYRVERMLLQLHYSGVLARQKALVLGDFSGYRLTPYDNGYDVEAMLAYVRSLLDLPVITGLPFGHIRDKVTLPVGCDAHLQSAAGIVRLRMTAYPTL